MTNESKDISDDARPPDESAAPPEGNAPGDAAFEDLEEDLRVEPPRPSRFALLLGLGAIALATLALLGVAWVYLTRPEIPEPVVQDNSAIQALADDVARTRSALDDLSARLQQTASRDVALRSDLQALERKRADELDAYASLPGRMQNLEDTMSAIQGISAGVRDTWLLAEAEYYMQIANAQLQLAGNPTLARLALQQADERISQLANPALINVRRTLADELQALELMEQPDIEGITLTLASLANAVDELPLRQQLNLPDGEVEQPESELSGLDRAMRSLRNTVSDIVSVRRVDQNVRPLIAPESTYFLRANLALQLQAARLALLRSEQVVFRQSLDDAAAWLREYYDTASTPVQSALQTIGEIRGSLLDIEAPDISESLRLLRQYNALDAAPSRGEAAAPSNDEAEPAS